MELAKDIKPEKHVSAPPLSIHQVALKYGVAKQTLYDAIAKDAPKCPDSFILLIAEEENELVEYCLNMQSLEFGLTKEAINTMVVQMLTTKNKKNLTKNRPTTKANLIVIQNHFATLEKLIYENCLTPDRIWNMDKKHISVCFTISAARMYILPLLIYKGVRGIEGLLTDISVLPGTVIAFTETRYMHEDIFRIYTEHFSNSILSTYPVLLMLDRATSHIDLTSIKYCQENNILLYVLLLNTTHIFQPSEIPFKKLKSEYDKASDRYHINNNLGVVTKYLFTQVFSEAFHKMYTPNMIRHTFATTGIWPLNPDVINPECLMPSLAMFQSVSSSPKPTHECNTRINRFT
ncbi:5281_t:CDS:2 [Cetraspora pellucida]|uniref:5281_t:CDS:1 n=1 Tax=Cetraspora pellucida TaxID=1433469 RepID=A0A9N9AVP8_9GLOM|nr:5281_t:CDS:2 [Cetraspora pellucida]